MTDWFLVSRFFPSALIICGDFSHYFGRKSEEISTQESLKNRVYFICLSHLTVPFSLWSSLSLSRGICPKDLYSRARLRWCPTSTGRAGELTRSRTPWYGFENTLTEPLGLGLWSLFRAFLRRSLTDESMGWAIQRDDLAEKTIKKSALVFRCITACDSRHVWRYYCNVTQGSHRFVTISITSGI